MTSPRPTINNVGKMHGSAPFAVGVLDSSSFVAIIFGFGEAPFYLSIIITKIIIALILKSEPHYAYRFLKFAVTLSILNFLSSIINGSEFIGLLQNISVCISILLTLALTGHRLKKYASGVANSAFAMCIMYMISVNLDIISYTGDRYHFFAGSHPNLGGELITAGVAMAVISLRSMQFFALASTALYCTFLMQSRTSTLAVLVAIFCFVTLKSSEKLGWRKTLWGLLIFPAFAASSFAAATAINPTMTQDAVTFVYDAVFLVDDQYRGGESGFSGRDQHWSDAIGVLNDHVLFGAGPNFMARLGVLQPHNWILYALSQFGLPGLILVFFFISAAYEAADRDPLRLAVFIPLFIPWLLNDRFLNFNAYPFVLYICVFAPFQAALRSGSSPSLYSQIRGKVTRTAMARRAFNEARAARQQPQ